VPHGIGTTHEGKKEVVALIDCVRESAQSWRELLFDLKLRELEMGPSSKAISARLAPSHR